MSQKRIAALIEQEVKQADVEHPNQPAIGPANDNAETGDEIATTQNTQIADLQPVSEGLFDESKKLWDDFVAFDKEHQLTQRVGAQLWRLTKAVGKPVLVLSLKGIQTAIVTAADADKRAALVERFSRSEAAQSAAASLEPLEPTDNK